MHAFRAHSVFDLLLFEALRGVQTHVHTCGRDCSSLVDGSTAVAAVVLRPCILPLVQQRILMGT
jgi:hypothetical protein